ncbi:MAG: choice-of-anchor Q domain-containing protein [Candidatus Paceibacterota bacterium]
MDSAIESRVKIACPKEDQRTFVRPVDGNADGVARCDIGSYEFVNSSKPGLIFSSSRR